MDAKGDLDHDLEDRPRVRTAARRRWRVAVAVGLLVAVAALGAGGMTLARSGDEGSPLEVTSGPAERGVETVRRPRRGLPIGDDNSSYWVAHDLPRGYRIVSADDQQDPIRGQLRGHVTTYHDGGGDDFDAALRVTTIDGDVVAGTPLAEDAPPEGVQKVTVRGRDGYRYPMSDDGQEYGTSLLWEQRPGLWIMVEAAEPLTSDDARSVAEGLEPYPADQWSDLQAGVDIMGSIEPGSTDGFTTLSLGAGTANGATWSIDALIPARYGELPADRRTSCARLSVDGVAVPEVTCLSHPGWIEQGDQVFVIGLAPAEVRSVTVQTGTTSVSAELFTADQGPEVQYWVATLGPIECQEVQVSFTPKGLSDEITPRMTGGTGPAGGCGNSSPGGVPVPPTVPVDPSPGE